MLSKKKKRKKKKKKKKEEEEEEEKKKNIRNGKTSDLYALQKLKSCKLEVPT